MTIQHRAEQRISNIGGLPFDLGRIRVIDTHTGGEPTRVIFAGGPELAGTSLIEQRECLRSEFNEFRSAVVNEPRGSDCMVGALLCEPLQPSSVAGVIFFNNVGVLGMCGHGTLGVAVALAHLGRIRSGYHSIETPVGTVSFRLHDDCERVTLENVASYRHAQNITIGVAGYGTVSGDVAWGGNWFFLVRQHDFELEKAYLTELVQFTSAVRQALHRQGVTGAEGAVIDHIGLFGPPQNPDVDCRCFVLCPGGAWDRSPCGTGTSAKVACLADEGRLAAGERWRQESLLGSVFEASYHQRADGAIIPTVTGKSWVIAEATLFVNQRDPFSAGIR